MPESHGAIPGLDAGQQVRASAGETAKGAGFGVGRFPFKFGITNLETFAPPVASMPHKLRVCRVSLAAGEIHRFADVRCTPPFRISNPVPGFQSRGNPLPSWKAYIADHTRK